MLVGNPSAGKSPALKTVTAPLRALEHIVRQVAERAHANWEEAAKAADRFEKQWQGEVDEAIKAGKPPPSRPPEARSPEEPHIPRLTLNDVTIEKLGVILEGQPRGALMVRDELAGFFGDMNRYNNGGGDRPFWLQAYDGGDYAVERLSRSPVHIQNLSVFIIGGIQPDRLSSLLMKVGSDDGMLARFCPVFPEATPVVVPTRPADQVFAERTFERLYSLEPAHSAAGPREPTAVCFDDASRGAMKTYAQWCRGTEDEITGLLKSFLGKTCGMIARIALVLEMLDWAAGPDPAPPATLGLETFERARGFRPDPAIRAPSRGGGRRRSPAETTARRHLRACAARGRRRR